MVSRFNHTCLNPSVVKFVDLVEDHTMYATVSEE